MINRQMTMYGLQGRVWGLIVVIAVVALMILLSGYFESPRFIDATYLKANSLFEADQYSINSEVKNIVKEKYKILQENYSDKTYAIVFDAGSTGSRIHVFEFKIQNPDKRLKLVRETFQHVKPGLSSYVNEPKKGAESLRSMLNKALQVVPSKIQKRIPIVLKATAGLRMLSEVKAQNLLNEVKQMFWDYPFNLTNDSVEIMDGIDEGIFSWMTVNILLDTFKTGNGTVAALDLGGGSTQVTLTPHFMDKLTQEQKNALEDIALFSQSYKVYSHSYLGQGLMEARFNLLGGMVTKSSNLSSPCLPVGFNGTWKHNEKLFYVSGKNIKDNPLNSCLHVARKFTESTIKPLKELELRDLYIFSYFYDRAADAGLIEFDVGGTIRVKDFHAAAKKAFSKPNLEEPFLGLDLLYIYSLLHDGYKLGSNKHVHLKKKINGCETSWCLGAAFDILSSTGLAS